ncbi:MAG: CAP domain-containing protein [Bacteroidetes bacterium]|nr:CAP domain-containing protein [Bacteroidota bacterium]
MTHLIQLFFVLATSLFANPAKHPDSLKHEPIAQSVLDLQQTVRHYNSLYKHPCIPFEWNGSIEKCQAGVVPNQILMIVQKRINFFRAVNGLGPITINPNFNVSAQEAALMMASNGKLSHHPDESWTCFSELGAHGAEASNLTLGNYKLLDPNSLIIGFIWDYGTPNYFVGHRRWLLYSRLSEIGFGLTSSSEAVNVGDGVLTKAPLHLPDFIAYPWNGYVPADLIFPKWSFSIPEGNNVDFSNCRIEMIDWTGEEIGIKTFPEKKMLDPTITWEASGLFAPYEIKYGQNSLKEKGYVGKSIQVKISNVNVDGKLRNYHYQVTVI